MSKAVTSLWQLISKDGRHRFLSFLWAPTTPPFKRWNLFSLPWVRAAFVTWLDGQNVGRFWAQPWRGYQLPLGLWGKPVTMQEVWLPRDNHALRTPPLAPGEGHAGEQRGTSMWMKTDVLGLPTQLTVEHIWMSDTSSEWVTPTVVARNPPPPATSSWSCLNSWPAELWERIACF